MSEQNNTPEVDITQADLRATEEVVADAVLRSAQSWQVLHDFYGQLGKRIMHTGQFTIPVLQNKTEIEDSLNDPVGFMKSFDTLMTDLQSATADLKALHERHKGREGQPDEKDWPVIFELSLAYQDLFYRMDHVIYPLLTQLVDTVQTEYGDTLTLKVVE